MVVRCDREREVDHLGVQDPVVLPRGHARGVRSRDACRRAEQDARARLDPRRPGDVDRVRARRGEDGGHRERLVQGRAGVGAVGCEWSAVHGLRFRGCSVATVGIEVDNEVRVSIV